MTTFGQRDEFEGWVDRIQQLMDEMLKRSFVDFRDAGVWRPQLNVYETPDAFFVCVDLAGVDDKDFRVECADARRLLVVGVRRRPRRHEMAGALRIHVMEIDEGPFRREIELPEPVIVDRVDAVLAKGQLWVSLPKKSTT